MIIDCLSSTYFEFYLFIFFFFSSRRRHTRSVSAFLLNRSSDLVLLQYLGYDATPFNQILKQNAKREMRLRLGKVTVADRSEERRVGKECRCRWTSED